MAGSRTSKPVRPAEIMSEDDPLDAMLEAAEGRTRPRLEGVVIGRLTGLDGDGAPLVTVEGLAGGEPQRARATAAFRGADVGCEVALMFEGGDPERPIAMGLIQHPGGAPASRLEAPVETLVLEAGRELVLRCGESSITLTRAGKILLRGAYLLSRSSGVNRIQGGSIQLN